jgi:hypothetical protein
MLSMFIFVIVGGRFEWKRISSGLFIYILPLEIQLLISIGSGPGFLTSYILVYIIFSELWWEVIVRFVNLHCLNNDLQNTTQKTKEWATRTPLNTGSELRCSGRVGSSCSTSETCATNPVISLERGKLDCDYDKRNISVAICDTDIPQWLSRDGDRKTLKRWLQLNH